MNVKKAQASVFVASQEHIPVYLTFEHAVTAVAVCDETLIVAYTILHGLKGKHS